MDREHCALLSRELGEDLGGSAPEARGWIAMEHPGPWERDVAGTPGLRTVADHLAVPGVRLQLVRPVQHQHVALPQPGGHTVLLAHGAPDPAERWMERLVVPDLDSLTGLDPTVVLGSRPPGLGAPVSDDVWLVCAHARRDACCAVHGRPVAAALDAAGVEVWETTHTGGHRFAATALLLPDGLSFGRLDTVDPVDVAADLSRGVLPAGVLRGRCALPHVAQAAEVALRTRLGTTARDGVTVVGHHATTTSGTTRVLLEAAGEPWHAAVATTPATPARPVSDGADPTHPDRYEVTDLQPGRAPGPPVGATVWIDESEQPGTRHRRLPGIVLGTDAQGTWLGMLRGTVARRGDEPPRAPPTALVVLVPHADPWLVECHADHPEVATCVDIGTRPRWQGDRVTRVDLDLDVVRTHAGELRVEHREEFDEHRRSLDHPTRLVTLAEDAAARARTLLAAEADPFGAAPWLARRTELE